VSKNEWLAKGTILRVRKSFRTKSFETGVSWRWVTKNKTGALWAPERSFLQSDYSAKVGFAEAISWVLTKILHSLGEKADHSRCSG
jgi:hypothetical protein